MSKIKRDTGLNPCRRLIRNALQLAHENKGLSKQDAGDLKSLAYQAEASIERASAAAQQQIATLTARVAAMTAERDEWRALHKQSDGRYVDASREKAALHEMFQRAATADRRTPMTKEDAALLTIGNDTYIVPKAIAARVAELEKLVVEAWGLVAYVGEGNWERESLYWRESAERLRTKLQSLIAPAPTARRRKEGRREP